jgi:hypothetical protein
MDTLHKGDNDDDDDDDDNNNNNNNNVHFCRNTSAVCHIIRFSQKKKVLSHRCTECTEWFPLCTKDFVLCKFGAEYFCVI